MNRADWIRGLTGIAGFLLMGWFLSWSCQDQMEQDLLKEHARCEVQKNHGWPNDSLKKTCSYKFPEMF